jgi:solute carrier family 25 carnitine/acylcarnitine transporter 20/29
MAQVFLACPAEYVKIQMQIQGAGARTKFTGPMQCARSIVASGGITALYRGFWWTAARDAPSVAIYFWTYDACKRRFQAHNAQRVPRPVSAGGRDPTELSSLQLMASGGTAGLFCWLFLQPVDVMKSLYQSVLPAAPAHRRTTRYLFHSNLAQQGPRFLLRGLVATCVRAPPVSAVIFLVYEWAMRAEL